MIHPCCLFSARGPLSPGNDIIILHQWMSAVPWTSNSDSAPYRPEWIKFQWKFSRSTGLESFLISLILMWSESYWILIETYWTSESTCCSLLLQNVLSTISTSAADAAFRWKQIYYEYKPYTNIKQRTKFCNPTFLTNISVSSLSFPSVPQDVKAARGEIVKWLQCQNLRFYSNLWKCVWMHKIHKTKHDDALRCFQVSWRITGSYFLYNL